MWLLVDFQDRYLTGWAWKTIFLNQKGLIIQIVARPLAWCMEQLRAITFVPAVCILFGISEEIRPVARTLQQSQQTKWTLMYCHRVWWDPVYDFIGCECSSGVTSITTYHKHKVFFPKGMLFSYWLFFWLNAEIKWPHMLILLVPI